MTEIRTDRAVSSAKTGVTKERAAAQAPWLPSGVMGEEPVERVVVYPPTSDRTDPHDNPFAPTKVGFLVDMDLGELLADCIDPYILAFEDALNEGVSHRPVELYTVVARGLPRDQAKDMIDGYRRLVDDGCLVVIGPFITDNSRALMPVIEELKVPCITWCGTEQYHGHHCFNLGNGGLGEESTMMAAWIKNQGYRTVAMFHEISAGGEEYCSYFRRAAMREGLEIVAEEFIDQRPRDFEGVLRRMRERNPDCLAYPGYGYPTRLFGDLFRNLDWDPPRIMSTAFMFAANTEAWARALEGWHGIDQLGEEGENENANLRPMFERFEKRFGRRVEHVVVALAYDTARVAIQGIANAEVLTPEGVKHGIEHIKWMPATNGGPSCYITFGPFDHKGYKGDWLTIRKMVDTRTHFVAYNRPQWRSNFEA